jgi:flagellar biogenesis protein FliO
MNRESRNSALEGNPLGGGFVPWLLAKLQRTKANPARIEVLERIALTQRNSLTLVEVETQKFLIATSVEGNLAMHPLSTDQIRLEPWLPDPSHPIHFGSPMPGEDSC